MSKFSFIVVSWNVRESLARCISSLKEIDYPNIEIIVVDNASSDGSEKFASIKNSTNVGFPKAVNQGISAASNYDYLVLTNPDTRLPNDFCLKTLEFFKTYSDAGLMGPKFVNPDGSPQGSVFPEPSLIANIKEFWLGQGTPTQKFTPPDDLPISVNAVSGGCLVIPKSTYQKIGPFTEEVFMFYEDLDYCRRARAAGLKVYFNPKISIIHEHGSSTKKSSSSQKYLIQASKWYKGLLKYYFLWFVSRSGQKLQKLFR